MKDEQNKMQLIKELEDLRKKVSELKESEDNRKRIEEKLRKSEERLKLAGKIAYDIIYEWTVVDDKLEWFGNIDEVLGYKHNEIPRTIEGWLGLIHPEDVVRLEDAVKHHRISTKPISYEYRVKHNDGTWRYWSDRGLSMLSEDGQPYKWIGVCTDVTERKKLEVALNKTHQELEKKVEERTANLKVINEQLNQEITERKRSEEAFKKTKDHLDNIIESSLDSIVVTDNKGYVVRANKAFLQLLGCRQEEVIGKHMAEISPTKEGSYKCTTGELIQINKEFFDRIKTSISRLVEKGKILNAVGYHLRKDNKLVPVENSIALLYNKEGDVIGGVGIIRDITERKKAEKEIKESREFLEKVFKTSVDGIMVTDSQSYITLINEAVEKMLGYSKNELVGKHTMELTPDGRQYEERVKAFVSKLTKDGIITGYEHTWMRKDGKLVDFEINVALLRDKEGNPTGAVGSIRDISERKQAEERLRESEERARALLNAPSDLVLLSDKEGTIFDFNEAFIQRFNKSADELRDSCVWDLLPPELAKSRQAAFNKVMQTGKPIRFEDQRQGMWFENILYPVCNKEGKVVQGAVFSRDNTEKKQVEERLRESEERARLLLNAPLDVVLLLDEKGTILDLNETCTKRFDKSRDELIGSYVWDLFPKELARGRKEIFDKVFLTGKPVRYEDERQGRWLDSVTYPIFDKHGKVTKVAVLSRDITELKQTEKKLLEYQRKLKALTSQLTLAEEKERRNFADYLHDQIGQKLFALNLQLETLGNSTSADTTAAALGESFNIVKQVIKDTRSLTFEISPPLLYQLGLEAALEWITEETHKQYSIVVTFEDDKQEKPMDDDTKIIIFRGVRELLTNIAKHAQAQKAKVSIRRDNTNIRVCVEDDGVGFIPSEIIFSKSKSTGFGLFSIKERLDQLGGNLEIDSQPGRGTRATLLAPLKTTRGN